MSTNGPKRSKLTLVEAVALVVILLIGLALVIPAVCLGPRPAPIMECANNLQKIYGVACEYAEKKGTAFPFGQGKTPRAHDSLNVLVAFEPGALPPGLFVCPSSDAREATLDEAGGFVLDEETCSYAWTAAPLLKTTANKPLASDKYVEGYEDATGAHHGHKGMNVLFSDGSTRFLQASDLPPDTLLPEGLTR